MLLVSLGTSLDVSSVSELPKVEEDALRHPKKEMVKKIWL